MSRAVVRLQRRPHWSGTVSVIGGAESSGASSGCASSAVPGVAPLADSSISQKNIRPTPKITTSAMPISGPRCQRFCFSILVCGADIRFTFLPCAVETGLPEPTPAVRKSSAFERMPKAFPAGSCVVRALPNLHHGLGDIMIQGTHGDVRRCQAEPNRSCVNFRRLTRWITQHTRNWSIAT